MHRFLVIEARRLLPLLFLLVLLVSLSIYDNFFRTTDQPVTGYETGEDNLLTFITADLGEIEAPAAFQVVSSSEQWTQLHDDYAGLPDYPFNDAYELALSAVNGEIKHINLFPQEDGIMQAQVKVSAQPGIYHVVTVDRERVGEQSRWLFLDEEDRVLKELVVPEEGDVPEAEDLTDDVPDVP